MNPDKLAEKITQLVDMGGNGRQVAPLLELLAEKAFQAGKTAGASDILARFDGYGLRGGKQ